MRWPLRETGLRGEEPNISLPRPKLMELILLYCLPHNCWYWETVLGGEESHDNWSQLNCLRFCIWRSCSAPSKQNRHSTLCRPNSQCGCKAVVWAQPDQTTGWNSHDQMLLHAEMLPAHEKLGMLNVIHFLFSKNQTEFCHGLSFCVCLKMQLSLPTPPVGLTTQLAYAIARSHFVSYLVKYKI